MMAETGRNRKQAEARGRRAETLAALKQQNRAISEAMKPQVDERTLAQRPSS